MSWGTMVMLQSVFSIATSGQEVSRADGERLCEGERTAAEVMQSSPNHPLTHSSARLLQALSDGCVASCVHGAERFVRLLIKLLEVMAVAVSTEQQAAHVSIMVQVRGSEGLRQGGWEEQGQRGLVHVLRAGPLFSS